MVPDSNSYRRGEKNRELQFGIDGLFKKVCEVFVRELTRLENDPGIGAQPSALSQVSTFHEGDTEVSA
jgi:hypothetical protein